MTLLKSEASGLGHYYHMPRTSLTIRQLSYHFGSTKNTKPLAFVSAYSTLSSASSTIMAPAATAASAQLKPPELAARDAPGSSGGSIASSTAVSKIPGRTALPDEAVSNPHHLLKRGSLVGFKNPYPSHAYSPNFGTMVRRVWWYVRTLLCQERFVVQKLMI